MAHLDRVPEHALRMLPSGRCIITLNASQIPVPPPHAADLVTLVAVQQIGEGVWSVTFPWVSDAIPDAHVAVDADGMQASCTCAAFCPHLAAAKAIVPSENFLEVPF